MPQFINAVNVLLRGVFWTAPPLRRLSPRRSPIAIIPKKVAVTASGLTALRRIVGMATALLGLPAALIRIGRSIDTARPVDVDAVTADIDQLAGCWIWRCRR